MSFSKWKTDLVNTANEIIGEDQQVPPPNYNNQRSGSPPPSNRGAPRWVSDEQAPFCGLCRASFTLIRRRHHCRSCGGVFCDPCSSESLPLPQFGFMDPVRVCSTCYARITAPPKPLLFTVFPCFGGGEGACPKCHAGYTCSNPSKACATCHKTYCRRCFSPNSTNQGFFDDECDMCGEKSARELAHRQSKMQEAEFVSEAEKRRRESAARREELKKKYNLDASGRLGTR
eukprot:GILI01008238.1.p1 GENE.GILI01008238.1~~GILI01008238.1.p1  ORF type:complete len:230 (-),score=58.89 GILI01008238.1:186-875(-)